MRLALILIAAGLFGSSCMVFAETRKRSDEPSTHGLQKQCAQPWNEERIANWYPSTAGGRFKIGLDSSEKHSGKSSAYIESVAGKIPPDKFGNLTQWFKARDYRGKHLRMSAWVKTKLDPGTTAQLWVRVDGKGHGDSRRDCFDNMDERPIVGTTDWNVYEIVVDVPKTSTDVVFGCMLLGTGKLWLDDVRVESVSKEVPLTGTYTTAAERRYQPSNLDFEANNLD